MYPVTSLYNVFNRLAKLQEINDKHNEVIKVANVAEGTLSSIQDRKTDLTKQTDWSQPAVIQSHMIIAEVMSHTP